MHITTARSRGKATTYHSKSRHRTMSEPSFQPASDQTLLSIISAGSKRPNGSNNLAGIIGNASVQKKLIIGKSGDKYEREADSTARRIMSSPEGLSLGPGEASGKPSIQSQATQTQEEKRINTKGDPVDKADKGFQDQINTTKGTGESLSETTRAYMERGFGRDFSEVRIYTDSNAVKMNKKLGSQAFTHKSDIYFNEGRFNPGSTQGKTLLAHELTHVIQQVPAKHQGRSKDTSHVYESPNFQLIQRYNKDVHYTLTKSIARGILGKNILPETIASEDQGVDTKWTHPTPTSVYPFIAPYLDTICSLIKLAGGVLGGISGGIVGRYIANKIKAYFKKIEKAIKVVNPSISKDDVLHFPARSQAINLMKGAISGAKNLASSFVQSAATFGKRLHLFQDSFSHSFPMAPGTGYNLDSKARHNNNKERVLAYILRKVHAQSKFPNTSHGKGAVIRHVILGHYPDDYLKNSEQGARDKTMLQGTISLITKLYSVLFKGIMAVKNSYTNIISSAVTHRGRLYGIDVYQKKPTSLLPLSVIVNRLNEIEGYRGRHKKYYILTPQEAYRINIKHTDRFYSCYSSGRYHKLSNI